jgi:TonB-linked SusC/RagA family outer membrane protein
MKIISIKFMKSLVLVFVMCFAISIQALPADPTSVRTVQSISVTGTVSDSEGSPLPGASIIVKGTTIGVITDFKGNYVLKVPSAESVLVYSFIGMKPVEIVVGNQTVINVVLASNVEAISEVVVTALGITREKKSLGYAVQKVDGAQLSQGKDNNIINSLSGKIAGVQVTSGGSSVGASSKIVIRGNSSFGSNSPLFVIDGTPIFNNITDLGGGGGIDWGNTASDIDPNNIETMTILKGSSASALYGSRATNGVIVITTKKSSKIKKALGVDINSSVMFDKAAYFPKLQNEYGGGWDGEEYIWNTYNKTNGTNLTYNDYAKQFSYKYVDGNGGGINDAQPINWGPRLDAGLLLDQWSTGKNSPWISRPNNIKEWFNTGITYNNSVAVSANGEKASGRISFTNQNTNGIVNFTDQKQNTVTANINLTPSDRLTATANITYLTKESNNLPSSGYAWADIFGWLQRDYPTQYAKDLFYTQGNKGYIFVGDNPFYELRNTNGFKRDRGYGNIGANYKITDWLSASGSMGVDFYNEYRNQITQSGTVGNTQKKRGGQFSENQQFSKETNFDFTLNYDKTFGVYRVDGLIGANKRNNKNSTMFLSASDLTVPDIYRISNVKGIPGVGNYSSEYETQSAYFAANGSYKNYLFLGITGRNDWSSTLPESSRSYFYPSVSLGLSVTDALQMKSEKLSYLKLRASWARVGGATDPYQLSRTYSAASYNSTSYFSPTSTLPPLALKPFETSSYEFGADMRLLKDRISLDVTYYDQTTVNQILSVGTSRTTGYGSMKMNAGEIENSGIEIMATGKVLDNKSGLKWAASINWAKNKSMVNSLYGGLTSYQISGGFGGATSRGIPGQEWGVLWGLPFVRNDKGQIVVDAGGLPKTTSAGQKLGNVTPDWTGGITNSFNYKGVNMSFLVDFRKGGDFFSTTAWHSYPTGAYEVTTQNNVRETGLIVDGVFEDGTPNNVRVSAQQYYGGDWMWNNHEYSILDGTFIKLREVVLGYDFNLKSLKFIQKLNVSIVGRNLAILYRDKSTRDLGVDPEVGLGSGAGGVGFENFQIPTSRSYGINLKVNF